MRIPTLLTALSLAAFAVSAQTPAPAAKKAAPAATAPAPAKPAAAAAKPAAAPAASAADPVVLTIGDHKITKSEYEGFVNALPEQVRSQAMANKRAFAERVAELKTMAYEAQKRKLENTPTGKLAIENALANELVRTLSESAKPDDAAVKAFYDAHKGEYEQVTASHILIAYKGSAAPTGKDKKELTKEEALAKVKDLRAKLVAGGDFAAIAKAESDDTGSGSNGGSLGSFGRNQMVPPFEQAAFSLPVGQISEPVETQFGYHLIKVEAHDSKKLDDVKTQIASGMKQDLVRKAIDDVKASVTVKYDDAYFPPAAPAPAPAEPAKP